MRATFDPYFCDPLVRVSTGMQTEYVPTCPFPVVNASTPYGIPVSVQPSHVQNTTYVHYTHRQQVTQPNPIPLVPDGMLRNLNPVSPARITASEPNLNPANPALITFAEPNLNPSSETAHTRSTHNHIPPGTTLPSRTEPNLNPALSAVPTCPEPNIIPPIPTLPVRNKTYHLLAFSALPVRNETYHLPAFSALPVRVEHNLQNPQQSIVRDQPGIYAPPCQCFCSL